MAAVTVAAFGDAGWVDPIRGSFSGAQADAQEITDYGVFANDRGKLSAHLVFVTIAADGDTLDCAAALGITGVEMAFWKGNERNTSAVDHATVSLTATADTLIFETAAAAEGYCLIFFREEIPGRKGKRAL